MTRIMIKPLLTIALTSLLFLATQVHLANGTSPFVEVGTESDVEFASALWQTLVRERIAGADMKQESPFLGAAKPHGWILELVYRKISVNGHTGFVVVKRNYDQEGLTVEDVLNDRAKHLSSFTVMFQREDGYDPDHQNWFWAKYRPDGTLFQKKVKGTMTRVAGRFLKGKQADDNSGCIYCHASAGGRDYIFYPFIKNE